MHKLIYLAGAMSYYKDTPDNYIENALGWRIEFRNKLIDKVSNMDNCKFSIYDPTNFGDSGEGGVYSNNLYYLKNTDILVVNSKDLHESPGTLWEIFMADSMDIPIVFIGSHSWFNRPHLERIATSRFHSIELAINYILDRYVEIKI